MWWKYEIFLDEARARRIFTTYVAAGSPLQANEKIAEELKKYDVLLYRSEPTPYVKESLPHSAARGRVSDEGDVVVVVNVPEKSTSADTFH